MSVEYDGPSLSDTGSLVSLEDYQRPISLSDSDVGSYNSHVFPLQEPDDDAVTISSHDTGTPSHRQGNLSGGGRITQRDFANRFSEALSIEEEEDSMEISLSESSASGYVDSQNSHQTPAIEVTTTAPTSAESPSQLMSPKSSIAPLTGSHHGVFERLRQMDSNPFALSQQSLPLDANERGAQWLRDQTDRAGWHTLTTPTPSSNTLRDLAAAKPTESDFDAASSSMGDLELQKDDKGKYYYTFASDSSSHGGEPERELLSKSRESFALSEPEERELPPIPVETRATDPDPPSTSAGLTKRVSQVSHITESGESSSSSSRAGPSRANGNGGYRLERVPEGGEISPELLQAILESESQSGPQYVTDCSSCGDILDSFRYVCITCGEKTPQSKDALIVSRSSSSGGGETADPFADPQHDGSSDFGLRLYNGVDNGNGDASGVGMMPRDEEDIADARSESSMETSSWMDVRENGRPMARGRQEAPAPSSSGWHAFVKGISDARSQPKEDFPLHTFKRKLKKGFRRGTGGSSPPSPKGKDKSLPSFPDEQPDYAPIPSTSPNQNPNSGRYPVSNPPQRPYHLTHPVQHQRQQLELHQQQLQSFPRSPHRRPEVVITGRASNSNSSGGSRSNSGSTTLTTPTSFESGYELCSKCIATAGVIHAESALSVSPTPTTPSHSFSSSSLGSSPHEQHSPSNTIYSGSANWMNGHQPVTTPPPVKKPKRKAQIRHAYLEKFWGVGGWQDVGMLLDKSSLRYF